MVTHFENSDNLKLYFAAKSMLSLLNFEGCLKSV